MTSAVAQKIGVSLSAFEHQFLVKIREAMEEKAKDLGVQIQFVEAQGQSLGQMRWSGADAARHDSYLHPANLASWIALARRCGQCDLSSIRVAATFVGMGSSPSTVGFRAGFGWNQKTMLFASAIVLTLVAFAGGLIVKAILRLTKPGKVDADSDARKTPTPRSHQRLRRPNGSELQVEFYGPRMGFRSSSRTAGAWTAVNGITSKGSFQTVFDLLSGTNPAWENRPVQPIATTTLRASPTISKRCWRSRGISQRFFSDTALAG